MINKKKPKRDYDKNIIQDTIILHCQILYKTNNTEAHSTRYAQLGYRF